MRANQPIKVIYIIKHRVDTNTETKYMQCIASKATNSTTKWINIFWLQIFLLFNTYKVFSVQNTVIYNLFYHYEDIYQILTISSALHACNMTITFKSANIPLVQLANEVQLTVLSHYTLSFAQGDYLLSKMLVLKKYLNLIIMVSPYFFFLCYLSFYLFFFF